MIPTTAMGANSRVSHGVGREKEATRKLLLFSIVSFLLEFRRLFQVAARPLQIVVNLLSTVLSLNFLRFQRNYVSCRSLQMSANPENWARLPLGT
jgi:hypothetical protein